MNNGNDISRHGIMAGSLWFVRRCDACGAIFNREDNRASQKPWWRAFFENLNADEARWRGAQVDDSGLCVVCGKKPFPVDLRQVIH